MLLLCTYSTSASFAQYSLVTDRFGQSISAIKLNLKRLPHNAAWICQLFPIITVDIEVTADSCNHQRLWRHKWYGLTLIRWRPKKLHSTKRGILYPTLFGTVVCTHIFALILHRTHRNPTNPIWYTNLTLSLFVQIYADFHRNCAYKQFFHAFLQIVTTKKGIFYPSVIH